MAYWRAGAYHVQPGSSDGYGVGLGNTNGRPHSADYEAPYWQIDGMEINRVLSYWRAGCYHFDPSTPDGYAAGCTSNCSNAGGVPLDAGGVLAFTHGVASLTGQRIQVTNSFSYTGQLWSLLWRPQLPAGWTLVSVSADGNPELVRGEVVWTGLVLPPSPIKMVSTLEMPAGDNGAKQIHDQVEYQFSDMVNPVGIYAQPEPLTANIIQMEKPVRLSNGQVQLVLQGSADGSIDVCASTNLVDWTTLTTLSNFNGTLQYVDPAATNFHWRFYRVVAP